MDSVSEEVAIYLQGLAVHAARRLGRQRGTCAMALTFTSASPFTQERARACNLRWMLPSASVLLDTCRGWVPGGEAGSDERWRA